MIGTGESIERTPYAVNCPRDGLVFMTHEFYSLQMCAADARWICPRCAGPAEWDDENYEEFCEAEEREALDAESNYNSERPEDRCPPRE